MATAVQIHLVADESDASESMEKFWKDQTDATKQLTKSIDTLNNTLSTTSKKQDEVGKKSKNVMEQMTKDHRRASDAAQLLANTFGIQMPRALEKVITKLPGVGVALAGAFKASVVLGIVAAIGEVFSNIDELEAKWIHLGMSVRSVVDRDLRETLRNMKIEGILAPLNQQLEQVKASAFAAGKEGFAKMAQDAKNAHDAIVLAHAQFARQIDEQYQGTALGEEIKSQADELYRMMLGLSDAAAKKNRELALQHIQQTMQAMRNEVNTVGKEGFDLFVATEKAQLDQAHVQAIQGQADEGQARILIAQRTTAQMIKLQQDYSRQMQQMQAGANQSMLGAMDASLAAENQRIAQLRSDFAKQFGNDFVSDAKLSKDENEKRMSAWVNAQAQLEKTITAIHKEGSHERSMIDQQWLEETTQLQEDAAVAWTQPFMRSLAQIEVEENRSLRRLKQLYDDKLIDWTNYNARKLAIEQTTDARIYDENRRMAEDLGQKMEDVFDDITSGNIGNRILSNIKKLFFQILANWLLTMGKMKDATQQGMAGGGGILGTLGGVLNSVLFGGGFSGGGVRTSGGTSSLSVANVPLGTASSILYPQVAGPGGATSSAGGLAPVIPINSPAYAAASDSVRSSAARTASGSTAGISGEIVRAAVGSGGTVGKLSRGAQVLQLLTTGALGIGAKFGGTAGALGAGLLATLGVAGLSGAGMGGAILGQTMQTLGIGVGAAGGLLAGVGGGLLGFGIGQQYGKLPGSVAGAGAGIGTAALLLGLTNPIGLVIGGIIGLIGGLFGGIFGGGKRRRQAESFAREQQGEMQKLLEAFNSWQVDSSSAVEQLEAMRQNSWQQLSQLKGEGKDVYRSKIEPEIARIEAEIKNRQATRDRLSSLFFGPPQFASGGDVGSGRSVGYRMGGGRVLMIGHEGEKVMNREATKRYGSLLDSMNEGRAATGTNGPNVTFQVFAMDDRGVAASLKNGLGRQIVTYINRAYREGAF